jgi:hypothetical protein
MTEKTGIVYACFHTSALVCMISQLFWDVTQLRSVLIDVSG